MSRELSSVARTEFDTQVKLAYQGSSRLRGTVNYRGNVVGDTYKFRLMGKGQGHKRTGSSSMVVPMNITHGMPTAILEDYEHPEYTDIFDQATVNFNEKEKLAQTIGKAAGRTEDQIIIDSVIAGTFNTTPTDTQGFDIAAGGTAFTTSKLRDLREYYDNLEVDEKVTIVLSGTGVKSLLTQLEVNSHDYNAVKPLVSGKMASFMGFDFITVGSRRLEGGLGGSGLVAYAWAESAVGLAAASLEKSMDVNYIPERTSWLCNGVLKAGGTIIDPEGTARIAFT